jgi:alpha-2-macroglobulin
MGGGAIRGLKIPSISIRRHDAERAAAVIATIAIVALVIGPDFHLGPTSPAPSPSGVPGQTSEPTAGSEWAAVDLPPVELVADLSPTVGDASRVEPSTAFTLKSLTATPAAELASRLRANPIVDLAVEPGSTPDVVTVRPIEPLLSGVRYRFELLAPDGSLAASWLFRTGGPLYVVSLLPADSATGVPLNTGIEVTFDQDNPIDFEAHFSIQPQVGGRFEAHGRTWAFVPDAPLAPATVYAVTITHGVAIQGSDQVLEADVQMAFETAPEGAAAASEAGVHFSQPIAEARPGEAPAFEVDVSTRENTPVPTTLPVEVYRLPSFGAAVDAAATLQLDYSWAQWSSIGLVKTAGLERVGTFDAAVTSFSYRSALRLPSAMGAGWYVVVVPRQMRDAQVLLQVTDLAVFAMTSSTRTVAWLNDLAGDQPIGGGSVGLASGTSLGSTGTDGLLNVATPAVLREAPDAASGWRTHLLLATAPDGRQVIAPLGQGWDATPNGFQGSTPSFPSDTWWHLLATDRYQYRSTDTVHVWGVIRSRSDRSVPTDAELRLVAPGGSGAAPIFKVAIEPTARGTFIADVPLVDLPNGYYTASLQVGNDEIAGASFQVTEIRKPAYRIDVTTDKHVYLLGEPIAASATVAFYDGTAAPGIALRLSNTAAPTPEAGAVAATTSGLGVATANVPTMAFEYEGYAQQGVRVVPSEPEEGEISGSSEAIVFKSTAWLNGKATLDATGLSVAGTLSAVDFDKVELAMATSGQVGDPAGAPIVGRSVNASVVHLLPVRTQTGTTYDFISKTVVPVYQTEIREVGAGTFSTTSGSDGSFSFATPVPAPSDGYRVSLEAKDRGGRSIVQTIYVSPTSANTGASTAPYLETPSSCGYGPPRETKVGEDFTLTVHEADGTIAAGRFLFVVGRQGITEARVSDSAIWSGSLPDAALPGFTVTAVRLSAPGYDVTNNLQVQVLPADKTLKVTLAPEQDGYRPGDTVKVDVQTATSSGAPIAADVIVRGVDEKLYSLGAAFDIDALRELMNPLDSGFGNSYASHRIPRLSDEGCGAAGGGERDDFRDAVTFQMVSTDAQGRGSLSFKVPDDLTSWHLAATAVSEGLDAGSTSVLVPVGLPFFVEAGLASEYLVGEQPVLRLRAYGDDLKAGEPVRFTVSAPTLGLAETTVDSTAFVAAELPLPKLALGDHRLRIEGRRTGSGPALTDSLIRIVHVVPTRLDTLHTTNEAMTDRLAPAGGDGLTSYVVSDAGRGALIPLLQELAADTGARFDQGIGSQIAHDLLVSELGVPADTLRPASFDITSYEKESFGPAEPQFTGLTLLPYSSVDLALTAHAAVAIPDRVNSDAETNGLGQALEQAGDNRERRIVALAGLAGLGSDVSTELRAIDAAQLTIREQLWLALGLQAVGDAEAARQLERSILAAHGERLGPWVRLNVSSSLGEIVEASSLMLLLTAKLGDPIGADLSAYLRNSGTKEVLSVVDQIAYAESALERLPRTPGRFAWSVDGEKHEQSLEPGGSFSLSVTNAQRSTLVFERLEGNLTVAASWLGPSAEAGLPHDPQVSIVRTVTPENDAPSDQLVRIRLSVTIAQAAPPGCYEVTEFAPSGLAPASLSLAWAPNSGVAGPNGGVRPYEIEGQRVSWCMNPEVQRHAELTYSARVVSPGTYTWEPTVVQLVTAPTVGNATDAAVYTIR